MKTFLKAEKTGKNTWRRKIKRKLDTPDWVTLGLCSIILIYVITRSLIG